MPVLAIAIQKGGTGKTTTTLNVGAELAKLGASVLLIDIDPQSNLTQALGIDPVQVEISINEVLTADVPVLGPAIQTTSFGVDLVPAALRLAGAEIALSGRYGRELLLRNALEALDKRYDYVLIDCPPSLGIFTLNAFTAADAVLVPIQAHVFAYKSMPQLEQTIQLVHNSRLNPTLRLGGIVVTMLDSRVSLHNAVEAEVREQYGDLVFQTIVPVNVRLTEAPAVGQPIGAYAANSSGARAYRALAEEILARWPLANKIAKTA